MRTQVPAVEGLFTVGDEPQLIGRKIDGRDTYVFPASSPGGDPDAVAADSAEVLLSRRGRVWSYTTSHYPPPAPYVAADPYEPIVVAAVELEREKMVVLGQMVPGVAVEDLSIGMEVEVTTGVLDRDDDHEYLTWMWQPVDGETA